MTPEALNQQSRYKSRIEDCDVVDRERLAKYRAKREEWLGWYESQNDEPNSIQQQIFSMIFLDLAYRMLEEPRRDTQNANVSAKSGLLAHLLDQGYVATQVLAIRRLLDKRKDVVSLRRLFDDIFNHKHLFTRELYVCYDGLPYDPEAWQALPQTPEIHIWGIEAPGLSNFLMARHRQEKFDRLSGISTSNRQRCDLIRDSVFDKVEQWLETSAAEKLITLSHKFLAHAANMNSLGSLRYAGIQLADVKEVHRAIIRVERAITDELLFIEVIRDVVPMTPLGFLKGLDNPYVATSSIADMEKHWEQLADERDKWPAGIIDELDTP
jgi:hypothetical protein